MHSTLENNREKCCGKISGEFCEIAVIVGDVFGRTPYTYPPTGPTRHKFTTYERRQLPNHKRIDNITPQTPDFPHHPNITTGRSYYCPVDHVAVVWAVKTTCCDWVKSHVTRGHLAH